MILRKKQAKAYHHGDLATGLLDAVENLTAKFGLEAVSLRACAKALGVSPAAAFRHYADKRALLTAFATRAILTMADFMGAGRDRARAAQTNEFQAVGLAYIEFALDHPAMFQVMWRRELLDEAEPAFTAALGILKGHLASGFHGTLADDDPETISPQEMLAWSSVHGLASLMVDGPVARQETRQEKLRMAESMLNALSPAFAQEEDEAA